MKKEEILIETPDARVRILTLAPGEIAPCHRHTQITDNMFCLSGDMEIYLYGPEEKVVLTPGARCEVRQGRAHQVSNRSKHLPAEYLLVQGVGRYDFIRCETPDSQA